MPLRSLLARNDYEQETMIGLMPMTKQRSTILRNNDY